MKLFGVKIGEIYFGISFSFFALMFVLFTFGADDGALLTALVCCSAHELGHLAAMFFFRQKPQSVVAYAGGIKITPSCTAVGAQWSDIIILLSGCAVNFILAAAEYFRTGLDRFAEINLLLAAFNLLPFGYFDGARVLRMLVSGRTLTAVRVVFMGLLIALTVLMLLNSMLNLSLAVTVLCICVYEIMSSKADIGSGRL